LGQFDGSIENKENNFWRMGNLEQMFESKSCLVDLQPTKKPSTMPRPKKEENGYSLS